MSTSKATNVPQGRPYIYNFYEISGLLNQKILILNNGLCLKYDRMSELPSADPLQYTYLPDLQD